jgi:hypothetical protein
VKDQFEVVPSKDLLIKEGFVPPPAGYGLELGDLTALESTPCTSEQGGSSAAVSGKEALNAANPTAGAAPASVSKKPAASTAVRSGGKIHPSAGGDIES